MIILHFSKTFGTERGYPAEGRKAKGSSIVELKDREIKKVTIFNRGVSIVREKLTGKTTRRS